MKFLNTFILIFLNLFLIFNLFADDVKVARVVIMRGQVKVKYTNDKVEDLKLNQELPEGAVIQTADKSFVKLIFIDKSQMNLGPSSQMVISAFPKNEAGIITLVKGQLRSQVTKDYMEMEDKNKSKLFIKTNTAAMGIRGTDFQVNYNPENQNTSLITFEGKVSMSAIDKNVREEKFDQNKLEKVVSSEKSVFVTGGHISAVNLNIGDRAMEPTRLAPSQINALKANETGINETSAKTKNGKEEETKNFRNPIPPGADGTVFTNTKPDVEQAVAKISGPSEMLKELPKENNIVKNDANGFFNDKTGEYKLPAGSIIDLKTLNIIPPPTNAVFDPNTKTFVVPESFGKVDKVTGEYKAPEGMKLTTDGKFQVDPNSAPKVPANDPAKKLPDTKDPNKADAKDDPSRNPTSVNPLPPPQLPQSLSDIRPEFGVFSQKFSPVILDRMPPPINNQLKELAQDKITTTETVKQNTANTGTGKISTTTTIIFNKPN
jgi:hypothetical protein